MNRHAHLNAALQIIQEILMMREDAEVTGAQEFSDEERKLLQEYVIKNIERAME